MSAAPGTGTAIPAAAATSKAWSTHSRSRMTCSRSGAGPSATARSPRSCATSITWPTGSTCRRDIVIQHARQVRDVRQLETIAGRSPRTRARPFRRRTASWRPATFRRRASPNIPGLDELQGQWYHTGLWPHEGVDFSGLRVGIIGTGSSGVQSIPLIARQAKHLYVFQRTANFSLPARNAPLEPEKERKHKAEYPERRRAAFDTPFGIAGYPPPTKSALEASEEERRRLTKRSGRKAAASAISTPTPTCC